jgi:hypothetical protein
MTQTQTKPVKRYVARIELRDDNTVRREFTLIAPHAKHGWELARKACRVGRAFDGQEPGAWTVRKVYIEQSSVAPTQAVLTASALVELLEAAGFPLTDQQLSIFMDAEDEVKSPPSLD